MEKELEVNKKEYFYKGNKLYNVKKLKGLNYLGFDLQANWKDKKENNKEKLGNFYYKDLTPIINQ